MWKVEMFVNGEEVIDLYMRMCGHVFGCSDVYYYVNLYV